MLNKILKIILIFTLFIVFLIGCYFSYQYILKLPKKIITYQDISLGMEMDEVIYVLGYPNSVLHPIEDLNKGKGKPMLAQMNASKEEIERSPNRVKDFYDWQFNKGNKRIDIGFSSTTNKVSSVGCYIDSNAFVDSGTCAINNIQAMDTEDTIIDKLGSPTTSSIEDSVKTLTFNNFNMKIMLSKKIAYYIIIEKF
jgi:hypothetical protein